MATDWVPADTADYVGLAAEAAATLAKSRGHTVRTIDESVDQVTLDLRHDRINLYVREGVVWKATNS
jgi:hypothetical protein